MMIIEELHQDLNPKLFIGDQLKPEVRERLLDIAKEFTATIASDLDYKVLDVLMVGSQAGYNYTENSDIDLHLVVNLAQICHECPDIVQYLFNAEKARFNSNYDITVKGIDVEIYVEDVRAGTMSNGIYSVLKDKWIKVPTRNESSSVDSIDWSANTEYQQLVTEIDSILHSGIADEAKDMINKLYLYRKQGLEADGEAGEGNLLFKQIRNLGLLDKLKSAYYEFRSNELTLEGMSIEGI